MVNSPEVIEIRKEFGQVESIKTMRWPVTTPAPSKLMSFLNSSQSDVEVVDKEGKRSKEATRLAFARWFRLRRLLVPAIGSSLLAPEWDRFRS